MKHQYKLIRSKRKSLALEISRDLEVIVRAPNRLAKRYIDSFVADKAQWIDKHLEIAVKRRAIENKYALSPEQKEELKERARQVIPERVKYYSDLMGLVPSSIRISSAEKRFGSCSSKHRLNFSYRLMLYPDKAIDYVVVHELAHIKHLNHSRDFYKLIEKYMPDYKERARLLKDPSPKPSI
jgi:predicted metal-dependent hydrolase